MSDKLWVVEGTVWETTDVECHYSRDVVLGVGTTREDARRIASEAVGHTIEWCDVGDDDPDYDEAGDQVEYAYQGCDLLLLVIRGYRANALCDLGRV